MRYNITDAQEENRYPIFVTLVAAVWMFAYALTFKPCSEVTNIGYRFSSRAVFGWILFELDNKPTYHCD